MGYRMKQRWLNSEQGERYQSTRSSRSPGAIWPRGRAEMERGFIPLGQVAVLLGLMLLGRFLTAWAAG